MSNPKCIIFDTLLGVRIKLIYVKPRLNILVTIEIRFNQLILRLWSLMMVMMMMMILHMFCLLSMIMN